MYKDILNYLGCLLSLLASITFTDSSWSGTNVSLWTPFTDNGKCTTLKFNLKSCTNICTEHLLKNKKLIKKNLSILAVQIQLVIGGGVDMQVVGC